jgi:hypothetical protein
MNKMMIYLQSRKTASITTGGRSRGDTPREFALQEQKFETAATTPARSMGHICSRRLKRHAAAKCGASL